MKHRMIRGAVAAFALALVLGCAGTAFAEEKIQLAILLDTSNSMDGLIDQAKAQLWKVVNELARAKRNGRRPELEVALFEYGNDGLRQSEGYLRMVSDLTTDLDRISERLFGLVTNGGEEFCGAVIGRAVDRLSWSRSDDVLKVVYIAGNEPFDQGYASYKASAARAVRKGIVVNTIFCGGYDEGVATHWKDGAIRAEGRYMSIDQDEVVEDVVTPFDADMPALKVPLILPSLSRSGPEVMTTSTLARAPTSLLRSMAKYGAHLASGSNWETTRILSTVKKSLNAGLVRKWWIPSAKTTVVVPPARRAPKCAAASMPAA
mgnify:CR=1 FL=1